MKWVKYSLIALGMWILYYTIEKVGVRAIWHNIAALRWSLVPVLAFYPFIFAFDTLGWRYAFPRKKKHVPFWDLYVIRIIGETLNAVVPFSASLGGEPIKAELLKRKHGIPLAVSYASILIVHTTFWVSLNMFVIGALVATLKTRPLPPVLWNSVLAFLIGLGVVAALLMIGLHFGIFKHVHAFGEKWKWWGAFSKEKGQKFLELDDDVKKFYTQNPGWFILSILFNFAGWFIGTFEVWYIAGLLGMPMSLQEAWLFEALIQVLRIVTFFIPSSVGAQEGGIVLIFSQFGYSTPMSLSFALIRRLREVVWIALGLLLWTFLEDKKKTESPAGPSAS
jgi:glycosyltransferase 2 family protein